MSDKNILGNIRTYLEFKIDLRGVFGLFRKDKKDMNISNTKVAVCAAIGAIGSFIAKLFGGWSEDVTTLLIFMGIDFIMGLILAGVFKNSKKSASGALESKAGWKGLCRKCVTLLFVLIAHRLDISLGVDYIRTTVIIAFIVNETISIIENAGLMGIPIPNILEKAIEVLKEKSEKGGE